MVSYIKTVVVSLVLLGCVRCIMVDSHLLNRPCPKVLVYVLEEEVIFGVSSFSFFFTCVVGEKYPVITCKENLF